MNCFTGTARVLIPGIVVNPTGAIDLGETGRARRLTRVSVEGATVENGRVVAAGATRRPSLVAPAVGDPILVRIHTDVAYTRNFPGSLGKPIGAMGIVAEGLTAWGDAGNLGSHPDVILAMRPGSACVVTFSGGRRKGGGARVLAFLSGASAPVILDSGEEDDLTPAHPSLDVAQLGEAGIEELITLLSQEGGPPNTLRRIKLRKEQLAGATGRL